VVGVVARVEPVVVEGAVEPVVEPLRHAGVQQQHHHQAVPVVQRHRLEARQSKAQEGEANRVEQDEVVPGRKQATQAGSGRDEQSLQRGGLAAAGESLSPAECFSLLAGSVSSTTPGAASMRHTFVQRLTEKPS
jgi:hypothetical protein